MKAWGLWQFRYVCGMISPMKLRQASRLQSQDYLTDGAIDGVRGVNSYAAFPDLAVSLH